MKVTIERTGSKDDYKLGSLWYKDKLVYILSNVMGRYIAVGIHGTNHAWSDTPFGAVEGLELFHGKITIDAEAT